MPLTLQELYGIITVGCSVAPDYFLYEMSEWEVDAALIGLEHRNRLGWEQTRFIAYSIISINTTEEIKPTDVLRFTWDKDEIQQDAMTCDDIARLDDIANCVENLMNGGV